MGYLCEASVKTGSVRISHPYEAFVAVDTLIQRRARETSELCGMIVIFYSHLCLNGDGFLSVIYMHS